MELKDLVGLKKLDGVDFENEKIKIWCDEYEDCQVCRFRIDGVIYMAVEDPDDGYRSSMKELVVDEKAIMKNTFEPIDVFIRHKTESGYAKTDILEIYDAKSAKIVLEVGTGNVDDYYPCFVASFHPDKLSINNI